MKKITQNSSPSLLSEGLKLMRNCPICRHEYEKKSVKILFDKEISRLAHLTCGKCQAMVLTVITVSPFGLSSIGMVTDLSSTDVSKLWGRESFVEDDVLDFYNLVESNSNFLQLLSSKKNNKNLN